MSAIHEAVQSIAKSEEADAAFIVAGTFNLYIETQRRMHGKRILGPEDIKVMLNMVLTLLGPRKEEHNFKPSSMKPSIDEEAKILRGLEEVVNDRKPPIRTRDSSGE